MINVQEKDNLNEQDMIWALLFALLFGSSSNVMELKKFDRYARRYVVDKQKRTLLLENRKEIKKLKKELYKEEEVLFKKLLKAERDENMTQGYLYRLNRELLELESSRWMIDIQYYKEAQALITENEWMSIVNSLSKDFKNFQELHESNRFLVQKQWNRIEKEMDIFGTKEYATFYRLKSKYDQLYYKKVSFLIPHNELLFKYRPSDAEIDEFVDEVKQTDKELFKTRVEIRELMMDLTTDRLNRRLLKQFAKIPF